MVARATGRSPPFACARHAPSRHRRKDLPDASVARRGALPRPVAHPGVGIPIVDSPIWMRAAAAPAVHALEM